MLPRYRGFCASASFIRRFPNFSQFSNFVWDNGYGEGDGDGTDENFALKLREGIVNMYTKGMGNLKRVVMAKICSQTPQYNGKIELGKKLRSLGHRGLTF